MKQVEGQLLLDLNTKNKFSVSTPKNGQLLKWIGSKYRFASEIISFFPKKFNKYFEPFLGSAAILGSLAPSNGVGSDIFRPLIEIWETVKNNPEIVKGWYLERYNRMSNGEKKDVYEDIKASFNNSQNAADFLFLSRSCYGGVIRFRKYDGYMSTPCGIHNPITAESFNKRVDDWNKRIQNTNFYVDDYRNILENVQKGDLVYCDPPYSHSQAIVYGAQDFKLEQLFKIIAECKKKGAYIALSIDGTKKSGNYICNLPIPNGLFEREIFIRTGRSMLKRFQMNGKTLEEEHVRERLLLTY